MRYVEYVRKFEKRLYDVVNEYIRGHTEIDDDDGILIDYRTHEIELTNKSKTKGRRGDFYTIQSLVSDYGKELRPSKDIINDVVSMYT